MCVKFIFGDLNPDSYPLHLISTYIYEMIIAPKGCGRPIIILNTNKCFNVLNLGLSIVEWSIYALFSNAHEISHCFDLCAFSWVRREAKSVTHITLPQYNKFAFTNRSFVFCNKFFFPLFRF